MKVVHCNKDKFDVYIGRGSKWGNPFVIGVDGNRQNVIAQYKSYLLNNPELMNALPELKGKTLGCYCSPLACHGDILLKLANPEIAIHKPIPIKNTVTFKKQPWSFGDG